MNKIVALNILKEFVKCLDDKYFLCYGSALGANREKNFIEYDLDIDVGIMRNDFNLDYFNKLALAGFNVIRLHGCLEHGLEISYRKQGIKIDLMIFYQDGRTIWNSLWDNKGVNGLSDMIVHSYDIKLFEIKEVNLGGKTFFSLGKDYLERVYGDWKTPKKEWDWRTSHLCRDDNLKSKLLNIYGR